MPYKRPRIDRVTPHPTRIVSPSRALPQNRPGMCTCTTVTASQAISHTKRIPPFPLHATCMRGVAFEVARGKTIPKRSPMSTPRRATG